MHRAALGGESCKLALVAFSCLGVTACGHHDCPAGGAIAAVVTVVDQQFGRPVCDGTVRTSAAGGSQASLQPCGGSCNAYCLGATTGGHYQIVASAPGFEDGNAAFDVSVDECGSPTKSQGATITLTPKCSEESLHDNGLGTQWADCTSAGTFDSTEAYAACSESVAVVLCAQTACDGDAGPGTAVCQQLRSCTCWVFDGPASGTVSVSDAGCRCDSPGASMWF